MAASSRGRAVHPDSVLQQHAATDRTASSIERLPVSGIGHGVGVTSPPEQDAAQLLPPGRITGIFHCILVLVQEESALIRRQLTENKLRVERILTLGMLSTHGAIVTRRGLTDGLRRARPWWARPGGVTPCGPAARGCFCCCPGRSRRAGPSVRPGPMSRAWCWCRRRGSGQRGRRRASGPRLAAGSPPRVGLLEPLATHHRILGFSFAVDHPQDRPPGHRTAPVLPGTIPVIARHGACPARAAPHGARPPTPDETRGRPRPPGHPRCPAASYHARPPQRRAPCPGRRVSRRGISRLTACHDHLLPGPARQRRRHRA